MTRLEKNDDPQVYDGLERIDKRWPYSRDEDEKRLLFLVGVGLKGKWGDLFIQYSILRAYICDLGAWVEHNLGNPPAAEWSVGWGRSNMFTLEGDRFPKQFLNPGCTLELPGELFKSTMLSSYASPTLSESLTASSVGQQWQQFLKDPQGFLLCSQANHWWAGIPRE